MIEIRTPARLHFGLLAYSRDESRQFGGAGLMVRRPETLVRLSPRPGRAGHTAAGRMGDRALAFAARFLASANERGWPEARRLQGLHVEVRRVPRPHTGLGSGTQLGMAVARGLAMLLERDPAPAADELAAMVGRGQRSAIGVHGFSQGGFLVEGGKSSPGALSPLLMRHAFPDEWRLVIIRPKALEGIAGEREHQAFADMPSIPPALTDRMCGLLLMRLTPALVERDLDAFGEALFELQRMVGACFAAAQGGVYADASLERIVRFIREQGVRGVGQSSWGPTLYAVTADLPAAQTLAMAVQTEFGLDPAEVLVTTADNHGAEAKRLTVPDEAARH